MKTTGITRRVDSLGRVVIPKELRKVLRIQEGSPLEIFTDGQEGIILRKYSPIGDLKEISQAYAESMVHALGGMVCIADRDEIIAVAGKYKKDYAGRRPSRELEDIMQQRRQITCSKNDENLVRIVENDECNYDEQTISIILSGGDCAGAVVLCADDTPECPLPLKEKLVSAAADFLGEQIS